MPAISYNPREAVPLTIVNNYHYIPLYVHIYILCFLFELHINICVFVLFCIYIYIIYIYLFTLPKFTCSVLFGTDGVGVSSRLRDQDSNSPMCEAKWCGASSKQQTNSNLNAVTEIENQIQYGMTYVRKIPV